MFVTLTWCVVPVFFFLAGVVCRLCCERRRNFLFREIHKLRQGIPEADCSLLPVTSPRDLVRTTWSIDEDVVAIHESYDNGYEFEIVNGSKMYVI